MINKIFIFFLFFIFISLANIFAAETDLNHVADLISTQGRVEILPQGTQDWVLTQDFQKLFPGDVIRTGELSRAAVLFVDHTQIKLNENTTLEIKNIQTGTETEISWGRTAKSLFNLVTGEIWVHSGGEALDLQVDTPVASATIRGTEFVIRTDKKKTSVTVVDGKVSLKNEYGEVLVNSGEEGIAEENKPPYKTIIINPEDAVQWSLYYPGNICPKDYKDVSPSEMSIIERFFDFYKQKNLAEAIKIIRDGLSQFPDSPVLFTQLAFGELLSGRAAAAKENILKALSINPDFSLAHSILSNLYLIQNDKEKAGSEAELAVKTNPGSPSAYVSLAWVKQSYFDIPGAIEASKKALELDDKNIQAYVTLCRLLFGSDKTREAEDIIDKAIKISPDESTVNSSKAFLLLAKGRTNESVEFFHKSIKEDSTQGIGHLGLGLAYMRLKKIPEALREFLISTLLEPKVSLYQSYMGKAYYQVAKQYAKWGVKKEEAVNYKKYLDLAEKTFAYAMRLDPKDPTPHLYNGVLLNDINKPVDAVENLNESIKLNNNRAVYRSRLLLDRDLATENISLANVYNRLGLTYWGSYLAMRSLQSDFSISGAHKFLGTSYALLRGRTQARGSELLQSRLLSPVNENSFNTFNTYTSLFEVPDYNGLVAASAGEDGIMDYTASINGGTGKYALLQGISYYQEDGYLPHNDDYSAWNAITMLKYATGARSHLYGSFAAYLEDEGDHASSWDPFENDLDARLKKDLCEGALGYYTQLNADTYLVFYGKAKEQLFKYKDESEVFIDSEILPLPSESNTKYNVKFLDGQAEIIKRIGPHQFECGIEWYDGTESREYSETTDDIKTIYPDIKVPQKFTTLLARDYWRFTDIIELDLGIRYLIAKYGNSDYDDTIDVNRLDPQAGILFKPFENTTVRIAGIRSTQKPLEENIFPTNTSGFVIEHNETPTSKSTEYAAALDQILGEKTFFTISGSYRDRDTPSFTGDESKDNFKTANLVLNRIIGRYFALAGEYSFMRSKDGIGIRNDNQFKVNLGFVHPSGWFGKLTETYVYQKNEEISFMDPFNSSYWTTNAQIGYELPKKQGRIYLSVENLLDKEFKVITDPIALDNKIPARRAVIRAEIYF